ncbi:MAG: 2-amino-4-hydroxy-6-hydroxymethyldihydropteridine diphosphokinase [Methylococcaceae bacterium]
MNASTNKTVTAYLGLGSNLKNPQAQVQKARQAIASQPFIEELAFSSLYQSSPLGPKDQPDYINAVMAISTRLSPLELLRLMQSIENQQGRVRTRRWGARTLDIDLLLYGEQVINLSELILPHVGIAQRAFVLYPLHEIAPTLQLPSLGSLNTLLENCDATGLQRLD